MKPTDWDHEPVLEWSDHNLYPFGAKVFADGELVKEFKGDEPDYPLFSERTSWKLPSGLSSIQFADKAELQSPSWLVKHVLPTRGLGLLYGESGAGKTFFAIHAALCVAWGVPFFGRRVRQGGVLYIAAEGGKSVLPRFRAANESLCEAVAAANLTRDGKEGLKRAPLQIVTQAPDLSPEGNVTPLKKTIQRAVGDMEAAGSPLSLIVVDTLHAAMGGADENSAADAGHALRPFQEAAGRFGVLTLIIHHPGKNVEQGARGSSSLSAAVDTCIELRVPGFEGPRAKPASMVRQGTIIKQRDGSVGDQFHYRLGIADLGSDADGDPWSTCTVAPCDAPEANQPGTLKGKGGGRLMKALEASLTASGSGKTLLSTVREHFNKLGPADETGDARRKAFRRALEQGLKAGLIETDENEEFVWLASSPDAGQMDTP